MTFRNQEWINASELPPFVRDELLGPATSVTERYYRTAKGGFLDPAKVTLEKPFVVAIAGSGKGIGADIALSYASAGATGILLSSRTEKDLRKVAEDINSINPSCQVEYEVCDVSRKEDVQRLASHCKKSFGRLDVAVINAAILSKFVNDPDGTTRLPHGILEDTPEDHFNVWQTNYNGAYLTAKTLLPLIQETTGGVKAIVFVSSLGSLYHNTAICSAAYNISKFALNRLAEYVHEDYKADGVVSFALHPGCIQVNKDYEKEWEDVLIDDISLPGGFCVWLTKAKRDWLSGRFISSNWDVNELESRKDGIVAKDLFKFTLTL
ncbi:Short-chain dehydrogenase/reductase SDR [Penicillium griseofulvum]|uniref:Short-chain dehydrogenase/reductase SDR n=1 Tax=Penicillium patulum TaxID=5078 RepID=A0A135LSP9_PENPA|nr:Short-chain dehydrogenase/reductase SDR [Penicillium griseofulvum]KXG51992.1 Short-chain dehydrogenase/reductase SDR [Penicillium griseofulvum]